MTSEQLALAKKDIAKQKELLENQCSAEQSALDFKTSPYPAAALAAAPTLADVSSETLPDECREAPGKRIYSQADLRNAIHADVNGDLEFATQCQDCFDFAALAVYHAVTVFLVKDAVIDRNMHVFDIFQEVICEKVGVQISANPPSKN